MTAWRLATAWLFSNWPRMRAPFSLSLAVMRALFRGWERDGVDNAGVLEHANALPSLCLRPGLDMPLGTCRYSGWRQPLYRWASRRERRMRED